VPELDGPVLEPVDGHCRAAFEVSWGHGDEEHRDLTADSGLVEAVTVAVARDDLMHALPIRGLAFRPV
jgi:hypothetical protein